jgi:hypothetical protein
MTEDNFEKFLQKAAQSYHAPPARVPRDEMWSAIQAKRAAAPRLVYGGGATYLIRHRFGTRVWLGAAAAAMLLVATGVGIGRWTASPRQTAVATNPLPTPPVVLPVPADAGREPAHPANGSASPSNRIPRNEPRGLSEAPRAVATNAGQGNAPSLGSTNPSTPGSGSAYQLTAVQHLSEAEALLTSFRARSTADQQMDAQLGSWARQLLTNTRLLLDSPVANDPQRRPLLEDLELVLVQIVQLSPGSTPQDRDLIEKTLQQDHVMTRLRTAIPAGAQRGS